MRICPVYHHLCKYIQLKNCLTFFWNLAFLCAFLISFTHLHEVPQLPQFPEHESSPFLTRYLADIYTANARMHKTTNVPKFISTCLELS